MFASVGDDRQLIMYVASLLFHVDESKLMILSIRWDTRGTGSSTIAPTARVEAHSAEVNSVAFAPHNENILITGSADKVRRFPISSH
jgi:histone-binding protein RBBP4